jgi:MFS family permease
MTASQQTIRRNLLFAGACAGITVFGIVIAMLGTVFGLPDMVARLHIDLAQKGNLFLLLYLGVFLASVVVGPLIDRIGNKMILLLSAALVAVAMAGFALAHSLAGAAAASVVLGIGGGGLNTSTSALVSDLYQENRGAMLNALGIFFGVGALAVPLLAAALAGTFTIPQLLMFCSLRA